MKWYHKLGIGILTFAVGLVPSGTIVQNRVSKSIPPYVESHLETIIKDQERILGIKHFGIPQVLFGPSPKDKTTPPGKYDPENDTIYLAVRWVTTPENNLANTLLKCLYLGCTKNIKETLDHELGHFYNDKLNESLGNGNYPKDYNSATNRLISEGIATYFNRTINDGKDDFKDSDWPEKFEYLWGYLAYDGGFHLVKPIIDRYGKEGIKYLITNPPNIQDLNNINTLKAYQNRVIKSLSKQNP
ncbi:MAG: hypothetical protein WC796_02445 [Candidatus Pacearchaeota archaeon]|jgi:hypothetical protein